MPYYVTYQQMVEYVQSVTDPMEEHMDEHDKWHLAQLTNARRVVIAEATAIVSAIAAIAAIIVAATGHG